MTAVSAARLPGAAAGNAFFDRPPVTPSWRVLHGLL